MLIKENKYNQQSWVPRTSIIYEKRDLSWCMLKLYTIVFDVTIGNDLVNKSDKLRGLINNVYTSIIKNQIFVKKCIYIYIYI